MSGSEANRPVTMSTSDSHYNSYGFPNRLWEAAVMAQEPRALAPMRETWLEF